MIDNAWQTHHNSSQAFSSGDLKKYNAQNCLIVGICHKGRFAFLYNCAVELQVLFTNTFNNEKSQ